MKKKKKSLLWQIDHSALARPSFLFGTMHVRDEQAFRFLDTVHYYLDQCDALATEYKVDEQPSPELATAMLLPDHQHIVHYLRPKQYQKLKAILQKAFGLNIDRYGHFKPLMIINIISEKLLQKDRPQALDLHLWQYAGDIGKTQLGIETLNEQLRILQSIPLEQQFQQLRSLGQNVRKFRRATLKNAAVYQFNDPQRIYRLVRNSSHGLRKLLLFRRNHIMAERIEKLIREQPTFCAVGAGHLSGKEGLIRLLKQRGFQLRPLPMTGLPAAKRHSGDPA
ncbi:TraB/GumN family protein [Flavilitoribacter nigricans]|uniref:TraB/GumN family protein n=1 Tax=Flavilitoribacter nigricans (strain ATCC 23147 / DSM 23189 / NBRC 102662 / NCIMB 1420 / SS-2) TaxID=1122177 RepID=A0A2D0NE09_FLAN2|nr:TraB/GumN family protein [Flavilitoribacter nigricans]PHN06754.1 hypothetical protein CRP01_10705 [Flavilitoribacter nigricans DSM 23189 = NBRC 102662]